MPRHFNCKVYRTHIFSALHKNMKLKTLIIITQNVLGGESKFGNCQEN